VAFLSANEKLYDPWKELMDFYQVYQDAKVSYGRIMEYFEGDPEFAVEPPRSPGRPWSSTAPWRPRIWSWKWPAASSF